MIPNTPSIKKQDLFALGITLFFVLLVYGQILSFDFVRWDDHIYVTQRKPILALANKDSRAWLDILTPTIAWKGKFWEYYPVRDISYGLEAWFFGMNATVAHGTNLLFHLCNVLLFFLVGRRFGLPPIIAGISALGFGIHPMTVEAVAWVSGRKDLMYSFFSLLSVITAMTFFQKKQPVSFQQKLGLVLLVLCAVMSKGAGLVALLLLAWLWWGNARPARASTLFWLIPTILFTGLWLFLVVSIGQKNGILLDRPDGFFGSLFRAFGVPIRIFVYSFDFFAANPMYGGWSMPWWRDPFSWFGFLTAIGFLSQVWRQKRNIEPKYLLFGCYFLAVIPHSGVMTVAFARADRFYYFSLGFLFLSTGWILHQTFQKKKLIPIVLVAILFPCFAFANLKTQNFWRNTESFWKKIEVTPMEHPYQFIRLALKYQKKRKLRKAQELLLEAKKRIPAIPQKTMRLTSNGKEVWVSLYALVYSNLADIQLRMGRASSGARKTRFLNKSKKLALRSLSYNKNQASVMNILGMIALEKKQFSLAESYFRKQEASGSMPPMLVINLLQALWHQGKRKEAIQILRRYVRTYPNEKMLRAWFMSLTKQMKEKK